jgi:hypothetical protein
MQGIALILMPQSSQREPDEAMKGIASISICYSRGNAQQEAPACPRRHQKEANKQNANKPQRTEGIGHANNCHTQASPQGKKGENSENGN